MTFLRLLWAMALKEIRWRWENTQPIPRIPSIAECAAERDTANTDSEAMSTEELDRPTDSPQTKFDVHLRYALIHQKLEMVNCCVERKVASGEVPVDHKPPPHNLADISPPDSASNSDTTGLAQRIRTHVKSQIQHRIGQSSRIRPIGRLLNTMHTANSTEEFEDIKSSP
ncbi:hypothetical protein EV176_007545, partial [Coemansia sp. RSA 451]